ncbi:uncharacterized protein [Rhodnius prolixus]|uniref:Uncharacterized protein n=2 Tax=Rhodnius TaxID=13248 RepID=T1I759_RHOPR
MEEILIFKVQDKRVLYDTNLIHYKDIKARNQAWEEIAAELGLKVAECKDMWCKLRNSYYNARKRRLKLGRGQLPATGKWKYEDQMSFLIPFLTTTSEFSNRPSEKYKLLHIPARNVMNYTIDETVIDAIDSDDEVRAGNESSKSVALLRMPSSNGEIGNHEQLRNWESPTQKKTSLGKVTAQIKPMSPDKINSSQTHSTSYTASSDEEVVIVEDDDCILDHAATSRSNAADRSRKLATFGKRTETGGRMREKNNLSIVIKKPNSSRSNDKQEGECVEEEYYLRLAKMAKKLKPPDRVKLRETVSRIVIDALINSLPED